VVNALASKMNFSARFALPSDGRNWGWVNLNDTLSGMIGARTLVDQASCHHGTTRPGAAASSLIEQSPTT
jgi:hypothetical protein